MKYNAEEGKIYVDIKEVVACARRGIATLPPCDEDEPLLSKNNESHADMISLSHECMADGLTFVITGNVHLTEEGMPELHFHLSELQDRRGREVAKQIRGEAYMIAALYLFEKATDAKNITVRTIYTVRVTGEREEDEESISSGKLTAFFQKCINALPRAARAEIERVTVRLPSMKSVKFPYGKPRGGQDEFIRTAYRTIAKGGTLYATAPTGTGKTVSTLFPAVRALGAQKCEKVFYLTPKTTTAEAARECIERLSESGAKIRAAIIGAKERLCINGSVCKLSHKLCPTSKKNSMPEAAMALFDKNIPVVTSAIFIEFARAFGVCPYELSLTYAELCDVIICDFNYLFDPSVYIRRFFSSYAPYTFLIDEAHNLGERAREMFSAEIALHEIEAADILGEHSLLRKAAMCAAQSFRSVIEKLLRDEIYKDKSGTEHAAYHMREVPTELYLIFEKLTAAAEDELQMNYSAKDDERDERISFIRNYLYSIKKFNSALLRFDSAYEFFAFLDGDTLRAKVFCLDTGPAIRERLELGKSAIIFSGTLSPINYYRSILGGDSSSSMLSVDSPFESENISVSIMNKITTRLSEREDSLLAVCRVIAATLSAKRGNYMIFSSSFAYAKALSEAFRKKYPKIRSILQTPNMTPKEKEEFLAEFSKNDGSYLAAFCVLGGIYSEGIDLAGDKLIGAVIVGIGMPALSYEREAIAAYYEEKMEEGIRYAYLYPGINRVLQAAGRVIRTEHDRGAIVLIDDRFDDPIYKKTVPKIWSGMQFLSDPKELRARLDEFWKADS